MMKRINLKAATLGAVAGIVLAAALIVAYQYASDPGSEQRSTPAADKVQQVSRGAYLARAGNCMACHTARGGPAYAGGRAIATPFGSIYASNITPDKETGIGTWTADDLWRAMHNGKSKDGEFLYPAFPYPNYTKVTREDSDAIFAYLRTLPAVRQQNREHELRFPFNQRVLLAFWRTLYFTPGEFKSDPARSVQWNRGAYLVEGLGHCSACHTARDALGGSISERSLGGGMIPMLNWHASSLASDGQAGLGAWEVEDVSALLKTGVSDRGAVFGPMAEVVGASLQHLAQQDIDAMAVYLKSIPRQELRADPPVPVLSPATQATLKQGAALYEKYCVECHMANGKGAPPAYPPLAGNISSDTPLNAIRVVLNGGYPPSTAGNPRPYGMPPFGHALDDAQVAAVVSYIRTAWGNTGSLVTQAEVDRARGAPVE